jgi:archaemetzincin
MDWLPTRLCFYDRAVKEIVHELGHTFGLGHCPNSKCVMHFSNSLADTDLKEAYFCNMCRPKIIL